MAFQQGLSGLNTASKNLDVIGHNIANANTTGMKASRAEFADLIASTGVNVQPGIGVMVGTISQQFTQGNISVTGNTLDAAINGNGFFQLQQRDGSTAYTRAGNFKLDAQGNLVTNNGSQIMGYPVDLQTGDVTSRNLQAINLPTAGLIPAKKTEAITAEFNLDARAVIAANATPPTPISTYGTTVNVYNSQGVAQSISLYMSKTADNSWRVYTQTAADAAPVDTSVDLTFDPATGLLTAPLPAPTLTLNLFESDGSTPLDIPIDMSKTTQYGSRFQVANLVQDGYAAGELTGVSIQESGIIQARYSNGETQNMAKLALINFRNPQGLLPTGAGSWIESFGSGTPVPGEPGIGNFGAIRPGALEDSNVDLTGELVNMMTAQRAYQANAQTIKTQDQVLSTLVNMR